MKGTKKRGPPSQSTGKQTSLLSFLQPKLTATNAGSNATTNTTPKQQAASTLHPPRVTPENIYNGKDSVLSSSSSGDTNDTVAEDESTTGSSDDTIINELSDYELLRLSNIARNNARLAALGLLTETQTQTQTHHIEFQPKARRKRLLPATTAVSSRKPNRPPTRRSTRQKASSSSSFHLPPDNTAFSPSNDDTMIEEVVMQAESYTVSPLMQYVMSGANAATTSTTTDAGSMLFATSTGRDLGWDEMARSGHKEDDDDESFTCLALSQTRLAPPGRLGAIYSLQFYSNISNSEANPWIVGAGKAGIVAVWDASSKTSKKEEDMYSTIDPILSWKAHGGRWIAEARFLQSLPLSSSSSSSCSSNNPAMTPPPSRLLTAANDGTVCLWDLTTVSSQDKVPKILMKTGKELHTSGIFALDVIQEQHQQQQGEVSFATASKDKTVAISTLGVADEINWWTSYHHSAKVGDVRFRGKGTSLLASVGDDGVVAIHDYRTSRIVAESTKAHIRPHLVVWDHSTHDHVFMTAGHDKTIKLWDLRCFGDRSSPIWVLEGHVPAHETRCKKIHRPIFYHPIKWTRDSSWVLSGGQNSHSLSMFHLQGINSSSSSLSRNLDDHQYSKNDPQDRRPTTVDVSLSSRGTLPGGCGDAGCIAVDGSRVAVSTDQAEVLLLHPTRNRGRGNDDNYC